jgi:tetratricopeptide (TPR) repeat protein
VASEIIEKSPEQLDARLIAARALAALGKGSEGIALLAELVASPERAKARGLKPVWRLMAEIHLASDELAEALPLLVHAHKLDRNDLELALVLGLVAMDLDDFDTGPAALRLVVVGHERHAPSTKAMTPVQLSQVYFQLALFEAHKGHATAARRLVSRALEQRPDFPDAKRLRAELA